MFTLRITGLDSPDPIELEPFEGKFWDVEPLNHVQLTRYAEFTQVGEHTFEVKVTNAARILPDKTREGPLTARMTVTSNAKSLLFGLVDGGWVPFPYAGGDTVLVDNNVIIRIEKLRKESVLSSPEQTSQHIEPHNGLELAGQTISPLPFVLEGSQRRLQSHSELQASLARAIEVLRRVLPEARIHRPEGNQLEGLERLLGDLTRYQQKANPFLQDVCHSVAQPASLKQRAQVEAKILHSARTHGVKAKSLVVLAVISCLYDHAPSIPASAAHRPGRAVLKPKLVYREEMAYAALLDLLFLELLTGMQALGTSKKPVFYTHDLGLAAFWAALEPRGFQFNDQRLPTGNIRLTPALCPALTEDECDQLLLRLDEHDLLAA